MTISQLSVDQFLDKARVGQILTADFLEDTESFPQGADKAAQVSTITVNAASNATAYEVELSADGEVFARVAYTSDASATEAEIADGLAAAIVADYIAASIVTPVSDGVSVVTLTARSVGEEFGVSVNSADLAVAASTPATDGTEIGFGLAVYVTNGIATLTKPTGNLEDVLEGVSVYNRDTQARVPGRSQNAYDIKRDVLVGRTVRCAVEGGDDAVRRGQIFVGVATAGATELGKFYTSDDGANRDALPLSSGYWIEPNVIELRLGR